jgi:hypothetical protein
MVASLSFLPIVYLLVAPSSRGRSRYKGSANNNRGPSNKHKRNIDSVTERREPQELPPPPPLTLDNNTPRPSYFTCRHTYEDTLMEELSRKSESLAVSSPFPGLVRVEDGSALPEESYDLVYALQILPHASIVTAESIKGLAEQIYGSLLPGEDSDTHASLRAAPRGSLAIHSLVPGMFKGQKNPILSRRAEKTAQQLAAVMKQRFAAARKKPPVSNDDTDDTTSTAPELLLSDKRWLLQVLLLTPTVAAASLTRCKAVSATGAATWPNWHLPAGLVLADLEEIDIPSSADRKLMEAFSCMQCHPSAGAAIPPVVDLGASPGGWTAVLAKRLGCRVIAVDRSALADYLMKEKMVEFVKGDVFTYVPEPLVSGRVDESIARKDTWMVSDVIAYPDKIAALLDRWCGGHWAANMIVTLKFQGDTPAWEELDIAIGIAQKHGYECRAKHFFNNKNEVTLMVEEIANNARTNHHCTINPLLLGEPMYPVTLPVPVASQKS